MRACKSAVFVVGVAVSANAPHCCPYAWIYCVCVCVCVAATYYDADVPFHKVLEHLDDILLASSFLEVGSTRAVAFLKEKLRPENLRSCVFCP